MIHSVIPRPENLRSTFAGGVAMKVRGFKKDPQQTSIERSYELEKILLRIHRRVRFPVRVRVPLVRNVNARRASGSTDAFATGSRPKELLRVACPRSVRHGILFHLAVCPLCSEQTRRHRSAPRPAGGVSVRRATFD